MKKIKETRENPLVNKLNKHHNELGLMYIFIRDS